MKPHGRNVAIAAIQGQLLELLNLNSVRHLNLELLVGQFRIFDDALDRQHKLNSLDRSLDGDNGGISVASKIRIFGVEDFGL